MSLHIVSHPDYDAKFPAGHRFPMGKYGALIKRLDMTGVLGASVHVEAPLAEERALMRAHDAAYVDQVLSCNVPTTIEREIGFPVDDLVSRRARRAAGGTLLAARLAFAHGIACNAAGGSHHARQAQGAGFCTFNDVAVAALDLLAERAEARILVVDLDVHQGDGTANILADEPRVFTFSMHAEKNYPARKEASTLDIGLPDRTGDERYLRELRSALVRMAAEQWDLVFYNAGVDPHEDDRLGRLCLSDAGLRARDRMVIGTFREIGVPVCAVIGGGYSQDIAALAARHAILFEVAAEFA
ncbi:histone deacetylase [Pseudaminobacter sp. 19-2017]|uniref:Histone deacetylase n=1 Tax=Pseudaminobacter soli (ex Zhang et al. 2022) TaxID=2831468 RepID=A0A942DX53_9HYPH|nr:histone deacetylase [Pseudaminobacter soli]MBS3648577.1 histone deacetylase [Pseudaminobacter soli]